MLESIGYHVGRSDGEITIAPGATVEPRVPEAFTGLNRIPILMLGPLLHRTGDAFVPLVGGDPIGRRPVDFHVAALRALGARGGGRPGRDHGAGRAALRHADRPAVPQRGRDRDGAAVRRAGRGQDRAAQRRHRARGGGTRAVPAADGRAHRAQPGPADRHRGRAAAARGVDPAGRRPARGVLLPGGRADHQGRGPGARLPAGPAGHRDQHAGPDGRPGSTSPTSGSPPRRRAGCGRPRCTPTPTPGS